MVSSHEKDTKILFYEIKSQTSDLLAKLIQNYTMQKEELLQKHQTVLAYLEHHDLNVSLKEIHEQINRGYEDKPYDIYISDKNLIIRNTTYKIDEGFDLGFAKEIFDLHNKQHVVGCSSPIRDKKSKNFLSYTDSYISRDGDEKAGVLEVSYTFRHVADDIARIEELVRKYPTIKMAKAYSFNNAGFIYELMLKEDPNYQRTGEEIRKARKRAQEILRKLQDHDLLVEYEMKEGRHLASLYMSASSPISENMKILYNIVLDESDFFSSLARLNLLMLFVAFMGIIGILSIGKIRGKEVRLSDQDKFVQSAMHEIKTPLSVITLNNELRQIEYGKDQYGEEIDSALKVLHNAYNSMSYIITKDVLVYEKESLELKSVLEERIAFFQTIAISNNKKIVTEIESYCKTEISLTELMRLIDNNLSNAIKYSDAGSEIRVKLEKNRLSFHTQGESIRDTKRIFQKYVRENTTVGGYGLGLSIVFEIAKQYGIEIDLVSDEEKGTVFTYTFICYDNEIT
jgi:signal transduction histidine kinase